jgi:N-acetylmuramoyl-L-alanine amidase
MYGASALRRLVRSGNAGYALTAVLLVLGLLGASCYARQHRHRHHRHTASKRSGGQRANYVALGALLREEGISSSEDPSGATLCLSKGGHELCLRRSDRVASFDGVRHWLSYPPRTEGSRWLLDSADLREVRSLLCGGTTRARRRYRGVVVDPGHGGTNRGARSCLGQWEKVYTLDTALRLERILRSRGIPVVLTRRTDCDVSLGQRVRIACEHPDFIFVSIHFNDAPNRTGSGVETYCMPPAGAPSTYGAHLVADWPGRSWCVANRNDSANVLLAHWVHREVIQLRGSGEAWDRGVKHARFRVLRDNPLPSVLVEGGFLSNRSEAARVDSPSYRERLAQAIARGVLGFLRSEAPGGKKLPHVYQASVPLEGEKPSSFAHRGSASRHVFHAALSPEE